MNQEGFVIRWIFILWVAFLLVVATGCAPVQTKSTGGQTETTSASKGEKEILKAVTQQEHLQRMLMSYADTFATKFGNATATLLQQESGQKNVYVATPRFLMLASAFNIASARYPVVGVVDMVILVTLERIVWEEYWHPEVFDCKALVVIKALRELEEAVWAMAAKVLTDEQLKELRALIHKWREKNPDLQRVAFIRLTNLLEWSDRGSPLRKETRPGGLFAPVTEATRAVDEIRFSAERAMYQLSRMQLILSIQAEKVCHDLANQWQIKQLLSDITGFREVAQRLPAQISEERMSIMRDLLSSDREFKPNGQLRVYQKSIEGNDWVSLAARCWSGPGRILGASSQLLRRWACCMEVIK